jgi:ectoine hydroxylase-related dioxygenase (phytanoyl-CoA dioxygenase family)
VQTTIPEVECACIWGEDLLLSIMMDDLQLEARGCHELDEAGFTIIQGPVPFAKLAQLAAAYDAIVQNASLDDVSIGSSTTRVNDLVNRTPEFDGLYVYSPVLWACCRVLNEPFRLSTMHARTLRPRVPAQKFHVDYEHDSRGWTMIGFIFMVDEFRADNGATRFLPGSHLWSAVPHELIADPKADYPGQVLACGPAGSMIVFNGSVWHGHSANRSDEPRRSIQGAYIRRKAASGFDLPSQMRPETLARISPMARYVVGAID